MEMVVGASARTSVYQDQRWCLVDVANRSVPRETLLLHIGNVKGDASFSIGHIRDFRTVAVLR